MVAIVNANYAFIMENIGKNGRISDGELLSKNV